MTKLAVFLTTILTAFLGFGLGFVGQNRILRSTSVTPASYPQPSVVAPVANPIPSELFLNPLVEKAFANVNGKVKAKTADSFVLRRGREEVEIFVEEKIGLTKFEEETSQGERPLDFEDIKIGDYLQGGVSIIVNPVSGLGFSKIRKPGDIIAQKFIVVRN